MLTLENVAADIWHKIAVDIECEVDEVIRHIADEYDCDVDDVVDDVCDFVDELYYTGIVLLDGLRYESETDANADGSPDDDIEGEVIRSLEPYDQLYSATFEMTYACNESCVHCYAHFPGAIQPHKPISLSTYRRAIDELNDMGCLHLALTGGDPFVHRDFPEVFFYARERGFVCDIYTNGLYLHDNDELLVRMVAAQPRAFFVSLYGSKAEIHDAVTDTPGSFDKTVRVIKRMKELGASVVLNVMLLSINHQDLPGVIRLARDLGAEYRVSMSLIRRNDGSDKPMDYFVGDKEAIKEAVKTVRENFYSIDVSTAELERTEYMCEAGVTSISIDPEGHIHPCISLKNTLGSIVNGTIKQAWNDPERYRVINSLRWDNTKECMRCDSRKYCPHCPGMSQAESGDVFACNTCDKIVSECIMEIELQCIKGEGNGSVRPIQGQDK